MTENQRLKILIDKLGFKSQKAFADALEIKQGSLSDILREKKGVGVSSGIKYKLENLYNINKSWIDTGEGDMFLPAKEAKPIADLPYPFEMGDTPFTDLGDDRYLMVIPLVDEYAYAGYLSGYKDPEYIGELPKHSIIVKKHHKGNYRAFEVAGDSMDNNTNESIQDGSIVTGREIQKQHWINKFHTHRYQDFIIVHKTDGVLTKRIIDHDVKNGIIVVHSLNPDKQKYPDFEINLAEVNQIFNIVNVWKER